MRLMTKKEIKEYQEQIFSSKFIDFCVSGYKRGFHQMSPESLLSNINSALGLKHRELHKRLNEVFGVPAVRVSGYSEYIVYGFVFQGEQFLVYFNGTNKGTSVETLCEDNSIHSKFCVNLLRRLAFNAPNSGLEYHLEGVNRDGSLKREYLQDKLIPLDQFRKAAFFDRE